MPSSLHFYLVTPSATNLLCEAGGACSPLIPVAVLHPRIVMLMPADEGDADWASCAGCLLKGGWVCEKALGWEERGIECAARAASCVALGDRS